jgi:NADPH2:quinone reductase
VLAIRQHEHGGPDVLGLEEVERPRPGEGELLVRVEVAGVNYADIGARLGVMHRPAALPSTPGFEAGGVVEEVGDGVDPSWVGARVVGNVRGGYAEYAVGAAGEAVRVDPAVPLERAIALPVQGFTALGAVRDAGRLRAGETVLVTAAAGGVGSLAVQVAKALGAGTVVALASTQDKRDLARRLGADLAVDYTRDGWDDEVREALDGEGVALALDSVGGPTAAACLSLLAPRTGRMVTFGSASGSPAPVGPFDLVPRNLTLTGFSLPTWVAEPGWRDEAAARLLGWLADGTVEVVRGPAFPLEEAAEAHRAVEGRASVGKVVLRVTDEEESR